MKSVLDSVTIKLPCPHCAHQISKTIGQLKTKSHMVCNGCGKGFDLDASDLRREVAKAENSLAKTLGSLGRLGK